MILGAGTDITDVERIAKAIEKDNFETRFFTEQERNYINNRPVKAESAAGIFAAKEAVVKALGTGFSGLKFHDIEIIHESSGKPTVRLSGKAGEFFRGTIHLSISHERKYAIAFAVAEGE